MKLHKFSNYEEYVDIQVKGNLRKINNIWIKKGTIKKITEYVKFKNIPHANILCHGTRNGKEMELFIKYLSPEVIIGTEISTSATKFKNTIQWDFHNAKDEWLSNFDIIYSNSLDHSYKPEECIETWASCLNQSGILIIEWTLGHGEAQVTKLDPFGASFSKIEEMLNTEKQFVFDKILLNDKKETTLFIVKLRNNNCGN